MAYVRFQSTPLTRGETTFKAVFRNTPQFQSTPLTRGETLAANTDALTANVFQSTPLTRGETAENRGERFLRAKFQSTPLTRGETNWKRIWSRSSMISIHSPHTRGDSFRLRISEWQHNFNPLPSHEGRRVYASYDRIKEISIHSPHTRGDSISLQKSIRIYVSLHNKTMIHRFSELYKPLFAAQSPIFGVRSPRESHDSFTFARPSAGRGITP